MEIKVVKCDISFLDQALERHPGISQSLFPQPPISSPLTLSGCSS